jgi:3',5'-cyclic AMP phosphodiesterase CpdA
VSVAKRFDVSRSPSGFCPLAARSVIVEVIFRNKVMQEDGEVNWRALFSPEGYKSPPSGNIQIIRRAFHSVLWGAGIFGLSALGFGITWRFIVDVTNQFGLKFFKPPTSWSGLIWVVLAAILGGFISAILDWRYPEPGYEPAKTLTISILLYGVAFFLHFWVLLPGLASAWWMIAYFIAALLVPLLSLRFRFLPIALWVLYLLWPVLLTVTLGFYSYAQLFQSTPNISQPTEGNARTLLLVQVSDIHFIGDPTGKTHEGANWNVHNIDESLKTIISLKPRFLLITGDITDSGAQGEWEQARAALLNPVKKAGITTIMAPGNHDLGPAFGGIWRAGGLTDKLGLTMAAAWWGNQSYPKEELSRHFLEEQDQLLGNLESTDHRDLHSLLESTAVSRLTDTQQYVPRAGTGTACEDWFPLTFQDPSTQTAVIVLCSAPGGPTNFGGIGMNAVGSIGSKQVERFKIALQNLPSQSRYVLVMLHHQLIRPRDDPWGVPDRWWSPGAWEQSPLYLYSLLRNEWQTSNEIVQHLLDAADVHKDKTFVLLCGHRHKQYLGKLYSRDGTAVWISEAPALFEEGSARLGYATIDPKQIRWEMVSR